MQTKYRAQIVNLHVYKFENYTKVLCSYTNALLDFSLYESTLPLTLKKRIDYTSWEGVTKEMMNKFSVDLVMFR